MSDVPMRLHLENVSCSFRFFSILDQRRLVRRIVFVLLSLAAAVFGMASWSVWKQKRRANAWGIAASALLFLIWTPMIFFGWSIFWGFERAAWYVPAIGAIGLSVFLRPEMNRN
jgi:hypothetical protein